MQTIIPAPTTVIRIREMTPRQSYLAEQTLALAKETCAFIAMVVFVCSIIVLCIMIKTS